MIKKKGDEQEHHERSDPGSSGTDVDVESTISMQDLPDLERRSLVKRDEGAAPRLRVAKAYKMYVGGAFIRSESGRYLQTKGGSRDLGADAGVVNVPRGSRKDARDAVVAAKGAEAGWSARTAYNRGQILYRLAEVMESRRDELVLSLVRGGVIDRAAATEVDASIDRAVFYAGFCDKYQSLLASSNPVSGPHFGFSVPEPMGVIAVVAPERPALLGLVSTRLARHFDREHGDRDRRGGRSAHGDRLLRVPRDERPAGGGRERAHGEGGRNGASPREASGSDRD